jgi:glycosyltransferase involved in cell wall biosynthesis
MTGQPAVSVIIPAYNVAPWLGEAIESVVAQGYTGALQVVVVDDGSTDATVAVARRYGVQVVEQEHAGVSAARNTGLAVADGDVIAFLDADDAWMAGKLERQLAALAAAPAEVILGGYQFSVVEPGQRLLPGMSPEGSPDPDPSLAPSTWLCARRTVERIGPFDTTYRVGEDTAWLARARDMGIRHVFVEGALVRRRVREGNLSADLAATREAIVRVLRESVLRRRGRAGESVG